MPRAGVEPCVFVFFGATGDLMQRKLLPALAQLVRDRLLPAECHVLGVGRDEGLAVDRFRATAMRSLAGAGCKVTAKMARWCATHLHYEGLGDGSAAQYILLASRIAQLEATHGLPGNRVLYLALPPTAFPLTIEGLAAAGLHRARGWTRLVIEKPFGRDLASARKLNALVHRYFAEDQVYRIDHYLGKESVQNLLAFRFGNALFESAWNRDHIHSVEISVAEDLGIEQRARYYEDAGALRDMVQNHLTQLLCLTAMEVPAAFEADSIRFEKVKVLRSVAPIRDDAVVFGQYEAGKVQRKALKGYRQEQGVDAQSRIETFVAVRLEIDNWRWQGVPFFLRTGKRLARRVTKITIHFRSPPVSLFRSLDGCGVEHNVLVITLQPDEGFDLSFEVKSPGNRFALQTQHMDFRYANAFGAPLAAGYETLLRDVVQGDLTLFVHADEAEASWRLYAPLLGRRLRVHPYVAGSRGPLAADQLFRAGT